MNQDNAIEIKAPVAPVTSTSTTAGRKPGRKDTALAKRETKAQKALALAEVKQAEADAEIDRLRAELKDKSEAISLEILDIKETREAAARVEVGSKESIAHRVTAEIAEFVAVESQVAEKVKAFKDQYRNLMITADKEVRVDVTPSSSEFEQFDFFAPL